MRTDVWSGNKKKNVQTAQKNLEIFGRMTSKPTLMNWTVPIHHRNTSGKDETPATRSCKQKLQYKSSSQRKRVTMY
jgi:hypothetical protein